MGDDAHPHAELTTSSNIATPRPPPSTRTWSPSAEDVAFVAAALAVGALILSVYGFWPGSSQVPLTAYSASGEIECMRDQGWSSLTSWCHRLGYPIGKPILMGLPQIYFGWMLSYVPGVDAWTAHALSSSIFVLAGFAGGIWVLNRWTGNRWIGVVISGLYLLAPNLLLLNGFGFTFVGYALIPAYVAIALALFDRIDRGNRAGPAIGMLALLLLMVFTDGYSFFGGMVLLGCITLARLIASWRSGQMLAGSAWSLVFFVAATGIAAGAYLMYVPGDSYEQHLAGLAVFRYFGVDLVTLVHPTGSMFFVDLLGLGYRPLKLWGVSSNIAPNYLGLSVILLTVWLIIVGRRRLTGRTAAEVLGVVLAGGIALTLSFGPDLKVYDVAHDIEPAWNVPVEEATVNLPTSWIFELPGFSEMRATFRWLVITRFAVLAAAGVAIGLVVRQIGSSGSSRAARWRIVSLVLLLGLVSFETLPNFRVEYRQRQLAVEHMGRIRSGILPEAKRMLADDELVLMLPSANDFLSDTIIPRTGATAYNVGGDKNYALARSHWPPSITAAVAAWRGPGAADAICTALREDADAIVLTHTNLRTAALLSHQAETDVAIRRRAQEISADPRFNAHVGEWMTVVRSGDPACDSIRPGPD